MNQFVAIGRRLSAAVALVAALAPLSSLAPASARAQSDTRPSAPADTSHAGAPADTSHAVAPAVPPPAVSPPATAAPAQKGKKAKQAKTARAPKVPKSSRSAKSARSVKPAASDSTAVAARAKKAATTPKAPKTPKVKPPEKSLEEQKKEDGVYVKGANWLSLRFGYAKRTGQLAGDGMVGYGVAYQHMITRRYAFAAGVGHDIVGHFGSQLDEAVPFTAEFQRYSIWKSAVRPYVGIGGGFYLRKAYRTAGDYTTTTTGGPHVSVGFTSALDARHAIGLEARAAWLKGRDGVVNPTFGPGVATETIWTAKLSWSLVY